jgi:Putative auto-transporter adhesin, head GIN domain
MKKYIASALLVLCAITFASAQSKENVRVDSFTRIAFRTAGKLYLRQGATQKVEVEGDKEYIRELDIRVEGGKLVIGKEGWSSWSWGREDDRVNVYVTVPNIEGLSVAGSGDLIAETKITARDIALNVSGSGSMTVDVDASGDMEADVSGSGKIDLRGKCRDFDSHVSGSGRVKMDITIAERAAFGISGSGKILASGSAREVKATISGSGEVLAADLLTDKCDVRISGSGDVEINVARELDANISGSGSVTYKGNPAHVNSHASGSGNVRRF